MSDTVTRTDAVSLAFHAQILNLLEAGDFDEVDADTQAAMLSGIAAGITSVMWAGRNKKAADQGAEFRKAWSALGEAYLQQYLAEDAEKRGPRQ